MVEAPAKEWSFNNAQVPWILLASYRNPNETVPDFPDDDRDGEPGDRVVITISSKEVKKPEGSGLVGKAPMFESEEEDDPIIKKQIEDALDVTGLMEELMLSEHDYESEFESSDDDGKDDLDETKQYH